MCPTTLRYTSTLTRFENTTYPAKIFLKTIHRVAILTRPGHIANKNKRRINPNAPYRMNLGVLGIPALRDVFYYTTGPEFFKTFQK